MQERLKKLGLDIVIQARNVGYELRCADPIPFDMEYTRDLGYCATKYLLGGGHGAMITVQHGVFKPIRFQDMIDPVTKRTHVRSVDVNTESYKIARRYMLRLRRDDFEDPEQVARFATITQLSHREAYRDVGVVTVVIPVATTLILLGAVALFS